MHRVRILWWSAALILLAIPGGVRAQGPDTSAAQLRARYEKVLLANPRRGLAFDRLYQTYADAEGVEAWVKVLQEQAAAQPESVAPLLILGYVHERAGGDEAALQAYEQAQQRDPAGWRSPAARGELLGHVRQSSEAAKWLRHALTLDPPDDQVQALYRTLGRVLAASGKAEEATAAWLELARRFPDDAAAIEGLADLLAEEGHVPEAIAQYQQLHKISEDDYTRVRAALAVADLHAQQQQYEPALAELRRLMESLAPDSWLRAEARRRLEQTFRQQGKAEDLVKYLSDWATEHPDDLEMQLSLASLHRRMDKAAEAEKIYTAIITRAPSRRDVRMALADLCLEQGRYANAADHYRHLAELSPQDATVWERLGRIHIDDLATPEAEPREQARQAWRNIFSRRADDPARAILAAEVFRGGGMIDEALEHYRKAIELTPGNIAYYEYVGQYLHELGRDDDAVVELRRMTAGDRDTAANWTRLAEVLTGIGRSAEALKAVDRAITLTAEGPQLFQLVSMRAAVLMSGQRHDEAAQALVRLGELATTPAQRRETNLAYIELYQQTDKLRPRMNELHARLEQAADASADEWEMLSFMRRAAGQRVQAIAAIDRALKIEGDQPLRLSLAVDLYREAGNLQDAIEMLRRLIRLQPQSEVTHVEEIATIARQQADWETALAAANRLIELLPDSERGYLLAADLLMPLGRTDEALATLRSAIRRNGSDTSLLTLVAQRLADAGQLQEAIESYWRIYDTATEPPQKIRAVEELAKLHLSVGRFDRLLNRLIDRRDDAEDAITAALGLAAAYRQANQPDRAESVLHRTLTSRPRDTQLLQQLLAVAEEQGKTDQAMEYAQRLVEANPKDVATMRRLGELLYDAGRIDEAVARWRTSLSAAGRDGADSAIALAETLSRYNLPTEALQVLETAAQRYGDEPTVLYRLAVLVKQQGQLDRAAALFDPLISRPVTAEPESAAKQRGAAQQTSYLTTGDRPFLIGQWMNLSIMHSTISREFSSNSQSYMSGGMLYTYYGGRAYRPPDAESLRLSALIHRLHIAESRKGLEGYLASLAVAAGYQFQSHAALKKAQPGAALPAASRHEAQLMLLRALLLVKAEDEAIAAGKQFLEAGDHDDVLAMLAVLSARQAAGPAADQKLEPDEWVQRLIDRRPDAAVNVVVELTRVSQANQQADEKDLALKFLRWALTQKLEPQERAAMLRIYTIRAVAIELDEVLKHIEAAMPELRRHGASTHRTAAAATNELQQVATTLLGEAPLERSIDLMVAYHELQAAQQHRRRSLAQAPGIFTLTGAPPRFPAPTAVANANWYRLFKQHDAMPALIDALDQAVEAANAEHRPYLALQLAYLQGAEGDTGAAAATLRETIKFAGQDYLRVVLAQLLLSDGKPAEAMKELQQVTARAGNVAREALIGQLVLAQRADDADAGKSAGRRLARMRLSAEEAPALMNHLRALELGQEAELVARRGPTGPSGSSSSYSAQRSRGQQRVELLERYVREQNKDAAVHLARRILGEKTRIALASEGDFEVNAALMALRRIQQLDAFIAALEKEIESDPKAVAAMAQLRLSYLSLGKRKEAEAMLERLFEAAPDDHALRQQFADTLANSQRYPEALPHYTELIKQGATPTTQGWYLAHAFSEAGRIDDLVEMIDGLEKVQSLSISRPMQQTSWLSEVAGQLHGEHPAAAIRIHDKAAELIPSVSRRFKGADPTTIISLAAAAADVDRIVAEFRKIRPDAVLDGATGIPLKQSYRSIAEAIFRPGTGHVRVRYSNEPPNERSAVEDVLEAVEKSGRTAELREVIKSAMQRDEWATPLGLPMLAVMDLRLDPPQTARAQELAEAMAKATFKESAKQAQSWRVNVAHYFTLALSRKKEMLPLAGTFADACLQDSTTELTAEAIGAAFALRVVAAQVAQAAGEEAKARKILQETVQIQDPNGRRRYSTYTNNRRIPYGEYQEFTAKAAYLKQMAEMGFGDIVMKIIADHDERLGTVPSDIHYVRQYDQQLAPVVQVESMKPHIERWIAEREQQLDKRRKDPEFIQLLARWHRFAGQPEKAAELLKAMGDLAVHDPQAQAGLATEFMQSRQYDKARALVLQMVREGQMVNNSHTFRTLFMDTAAAKELVEAMEAMPKNAQTLQRGAYWLGNFASMLSGGKGEAAELKTRGLKIVDGLSGVPGVPQNYGQQNRYYLTQLIQHWKSIDQQDEAYSYLYRSVFDAKELGLPEPSAYQLFYPYNYYNQTDEPKGSLAADLIELAAKCEQLPKLRETVEQRIGSDIVWEPIARRLLVFMDLHGGNTDKVAEAVARIEQLPPLPVEAGFDPSMMSIAERAAKHESLKPLAIKLAEEAFEAASLSREGEQMVGMIGPLLLGSYADAGEHEKLAVMLERLWQAGSRNYVASERTSFMLGACMRAADAYAKAGDHVRAADYLRVILRYPGRMVRTSNSYNQQPAGEPLIKSLRQLQEAGTLAAYVQRAEQQWQALSSTADAVNAEPLMTLAAMAALSGQTEQAVARLKQLRSGDYPAGLSLVIDAALALEQPQERRRMLEVIEPLFTVWPELAELQPSGGGDKLNIAHLYRSVNQPLPVGPALQQTIRRFKPPDASSPRRSQDEALVAFDGSPNVAGAEPPDDVQRAPLVGQRLSELLSGMDREREADAYYELSRALFEHLKLSGAAPLYFEAMLQRDPATGYTLAAQWLGLIEVPKEQEKTAVRAPGAISVYQIFTPLQMTGPLDEPSICTGEVVARLAEAAGKLPQLIEAAEEAAKKAPTGQTVYYSGGPRPSLGLARDAALRLKLMALALHDPPEARKLIALLQEGKGEFEQPEAVTPSGQRYDRTLPQIAAFCGRVESLKDLQRPLLEESRRQVRSVMTEMYSTGQAANYIYFDSRPWMDLIRLHLRDAEVGPAMMLVDELLEQYRTRLLPPSRNVLMAAPLQDIAAMTELAQRYHSAAALRERIQQTLSAGVKDEQIKQRLEQAVEKLNTEPAAKPAAAPAKEWQRMPGTEQIKQELDQFRADFEALRQEIGKVIVGHQEIVDGTLTALVTGGHVLLEGVPGLGKTRLVRTLADALDMSFGRIQFTPDLMPADLTGTNIVAETATGQKQFEFQRGPVFANVVLADEINRATPKTQSALLEAMQEQSVTVAGHTWPLPRPFFVMATQNPLEMEGTYPLPEAQLDRFMFKLLVRFPNSAEIEAILDRTTESAEPTVDRIFDGERVLKMRELARQIPIAADVRRYGVELVMATHPESEIAPKITRTYVRYGSSPRGAQALILAAKIRAILDHRYHVAREDIRSVAHAALRHRLILNFEGQAENVRPDHVIDEIVDSLSVAAAA